MMLPDIRAQRAPDEVDFSDITPATQIGPAFWHQTEADALVVPFDVTPTPAQALAIRRRLVTVDAADEKHLYALLAAYKDPAAPSWAKTILATELAQYGEPV